MQPTRFAYMSQFTAAMKIAELAWLQANADNVVYEIRADRPFAMHGAIPKFTIVSTPAMQSLPLDWTATDWVLQPDATYLVSRRRKLPVPGAARV